MYEVITVGERSALLQVRFHQYELVCTSFRMKQRGNDTPSRFFAEVLTRNKARTSTTKGVSAFFRRQPTIKNNNGVQSI